MCCMVRAPCSILYALAIDHRKGARPEEPLRLAFARAFAHARMCLSADNDCRLALLWCAAEGMIRRSTLHFTDAWIHGVGTSDCATLARLLFHHPLTLWGFWGIN